MSADSAFIARLHAQSTLGELPVFGRSLELDMRGQELADLLEQDAELPGVVVTEEGSVRGVISRGQYLRLISRQFGHEVYLPRELRLMWKAVEQDEEPLVLSARTPIQRAVFEALQRPRGLIYEPVIVSDGPADLNLVDFPDLLRADSRLSALRNQQMSQILETVREGFLLVDIDHRIAAEYSKSIETIFESEEIAGRTLPELLGESLGEQKAELAAGYLGTLFNPNVIEHLVADINPLMRVAADLPSGLKHLSFRFVRSVEKKQIRRILVRVEDMTRQVALAEEIEAQQRLAQEKVDLVFDIVRADAEHLGRFLGHLDQVLRSSEDLLGERGASLPMGDLLTALFRDLHGLKGEAGLLKMELFQRTIHQVEDRIVEVRELPSPGPDDLASVRSGLDVLRQLVDETAGMVQQFRQLGSVLSRPASSPASSPESTPPRPCPVRTPPPSPIPAPAAARNGLLEQISGLVEDLGRKLDKPARFVSRASLDQVPARYADLLRESLVQFARNSIVHGLESRQVRRQRGKSELGTLQFAVRRHDEKGHIELIFQDDGGGLDLEKIRRRALAKGLSFTEAELPLMIFRSGFSTADETTLDAGRGVGMDVIRDRVHELGGHVIPHFKSGVFCAFQIVLPL